MAPLQSLRSSLLTLGGVALASVALVLVGMWGIVFYANGRGRLRLFRRFRKNEFRQRHRERFAPFGSQAESNTRQTKRRNRPPDWINCRVKLARQFKWDAGHARNPSSLLKNAIVTFFNPSQVQSKLRTARKSRHFHATIWNPILGFSQPIE